MQRESHDDIPENLVTLQRSEVNRLAGGFIKQLNSIRIHLEDTAKGPTPPELSIFRKSYKPIPPNKRRELELAAKQMAIQQFQGTDMEDEIYRLFIYEDMSFYGTHHHKTPEYERVWIAKRFIPISLSSDIAALVDETVKKARTQRVGDIFDIRNWHQLVQVRFQLGESLERNDAKTYIYHCDVSTPEQLPTTETGEDTAQKYSNRLSAKGIEQFIASTVKDTKMPERVQFAQLFERTK